MIVGHKFLVDFDRNRTYTCIERGPAALYHTYILLAGVYESNMAKRHAA